MIGIRPEDILSAESHRYKEGDGLIRGKVENAELTGSEMCLTIEAAGKRLTARVSSRIGAAAGDEVTPAIDGEKLHLFDRETEQVIR